MPLTLAAFVLAVVVAVPVGFLRRAPLRQLVRRRCSRAVSQLGIAVPAFWLGMLLVWVFALRLRAAAGRRVPAATAGPTRPTPSGSLVLPVVTVALVMAASLIRYVRSATLDVLGSDYLRTARALGSSFPGAMWRHGAAQRAPCRWSRSSASSSPPRSSARSSSRASSRCPASAACCVRGIAQHDYPVIQGVLFVSTFAVLVVGFLADVAQRLIDPRLRGRLGRCACR